MEMLILISGCRGGSANKITAVLPLFPYSKQSKMKKHRGAITARMLANLVTMAGADHVITMDLHASQMQGFFSKPVDNLYAGPTLARWIKHNVPDYINAVIVSKNPGGTKRVTALADALKVNFAMIHTDRRRENHQSQIAIANGKIAASGELVADGGSDDSNNSIRVARVVGGHVAEDDEDDDTASLSSVQVARVVRGHVVNNRTGGNGSSEDSDVEDELAASIASLPREDSVSHRHALGGTVDAGPSDDEEEINPGEEQVIALVGDVRDRTAIILDDMIDRPSSFIAAAEHCRLNCGAKDVYIVGTHGVFSDGSLEALTDSPYIDKIVVTNTYPIPPHRRTSKLVVIDISSIFAECIRRNHHGESISALFEQLASF
jgi:ribose-phosphate pyrophosphokinase